MNVTVIAEMVLATEGFTTDVAGVWSFVGMGALMDKQVVGLGEMTVAVFTDELFLWTCAAMPGNLHWAKLAYWATEGRNAGKVRRIALMLHMLPIDSSIANPLLHESVGLLSSDCRKLSITWQRITGLMEVLLSGCRSLSLEPQAMLLLSLLLLLMLLLMLLLCMLLLLIKKSLHRSRLTVGRCLLGKEGTCDLRVWMLMVMKSMMVLVMWWGPVQLHIVVMARCDHGRCCINTVLGGCVRWG